MSQHNEEVSKMLEESQLGSRQHASKVVIYEEGSEDDEPIVCDDEEDNQGISNANEKVPEESL